jgi:hypothetical protein
MATLKSGNYELEITSVPPNCLLTDKLEFTVSKDKIYYYSRSLYMYFDEAKADLHINNFQENALYQLYSVSNKEQLVSTFQDSKVFSLELGSYYLIDLKQNKKYDLLLEYKDFLTPVVVYNLDIYPENQVDSNYTEIDESIDNNKEESDILDSEKEFIDNKNIDESKDNNENAIKEEESLLENIDENIADNSSIEEELSSEVIKDEFNLSELPNTSNYILELKTLLCLLLIYKILKHEK